jgi:hypothetical protein
MILYLHGLRLYPISPYDCVRNFISKIYPLVLAAAFCNSKYMNIHVLQHVAFEGLGSKELGSVPLSSYRTINLAMNEVLAYLIEAPRKHIL